MFRLNQYLFRWTAASIHLKLYVPLWFDQEYLPYLHFDSIWSLLLKVFVFSAVPLGIGRLQTASWSAATCASVWSCEYHLGWDLLHWQRGNSRWFTSSHKLSPLPPPSSTTCSTRRSGHPLSSWYQILRFTRWAIHPHRLVVLVLYRKSHTKILGFIVYCHSLNNTVREF